MSDFLVGAIFGAGLAVLLCGLAVYGLYRLGKSGAIAARASVVSTADDAAQLREQITIVKTGEDGHATTIN